MGRPLVAANDPGYNQVLPHAHRDPLSLAYRWLVGVRTVRLPVLGGRCSHCHHHNGVDMGVSGPPVQNSLVKG